MTKLFAMTRFAAFLAILVAGLATVLNADSLDAVDPMIGTASWSLR